MDPADARPLVLILQQEPPPSHPAWKTRCVAGVGELLAILRLDGEVAAAVFPSIATAEGVPLAEEVRRLRPDVATLDLPWNEDATAKALHRRQAQRATAWITRGCLTVLPQAATLARLRDVFHDANNPLGAILGNLASLGHVSTDAGVRDAVSDGLEALAIVRQVFERARRESTPPSPARRGSAVTMAVVAEAVTGMLAAPPRVRAVAEGMLSSEELVFWGPLLLLLVDEETATLEIHRDGAAWRLDVNHRRQEPGPAAAELVQCLGGTLDAVPAPDGETAWRVVLPVLA